MLGLDLTLSYNGTPVVHGASIELAPGQITALVGPNGSGKSTLLRALARLHAPDSGRVLLVDDADSEQPGIDALALTNREFARRVTLLAQSRPTPSGLTVREVVEFGRHPHRGRWRRGDADGTAVVDRVMTLTGIEELADRPVDRLSGGQLQRVWLATCLAQDTTVLLLDEPTTYLDLRYQVELLDLIRDLAEHHGVTIGIVLHDLDQAALIADRVVLLEEGQVRAVGTPHDVLTGDVLSSVYGIRIEVDADQETGVIRTRPVGRYGARSLPRVVALA
ncbi:ABC transporter ATP-binding protein [Glaciibacter superstes]|uniref:ABC transporter ATP-binding protein n=1 Tax=Glaciibacter superstes TaxID=501023 RepID=UPI0003B4A418|nr:ABC transporter ATP-binding protein [Glaciibacter superstes]